MPNFLTLVLVAVSLAAIVQFPELSAKVVPPLDPSICKSKVTSAKLASPMLAGSVPTLPPVGFAANTPLL